MTNTEITTEEGFITISVDETVVVKIESFTQHIEAICKLLNINLELLGLTEIQIEIVLRLARTQDNFSIAFWND